MHKQTLFTIYALVATFFLYHAQLHAAKDNFQNVTITLDDGLSENFVDYIYKDSDGYMWFATWAGLDRYDGYNFTHFSHHDKIQPLTSNFVRMMCEDKFKRLWLGTEEGINIFDLKKETLSTLQLDQKFHQLSATSINALYSDHHGNMWVGSTSGICKIHFDKNGVVTDSEIMNSSDDLMNITAIFEDSENRIWLGTPLGEIKLLDNRESQGFHLQNLSVDTSPLSNRIINDFEEDKDGNIWIATNIGLFKYLKEKNGLSFFRLIPPYAYHITMLTPYR